MSTSRPSSPKCEANSFLVLAGLIYSKPTNQDPNNDYNSFDMTPRPPDRCTVDESIPGAAAVGFGRGNQFITGQCFSAADCKQRCCVAQGRVSLCMARLPTEEAGLSCDFECGIG